MPVFRVLMRLTTRVLGATPRSWTEQFYVNFTSTAVDTVPITAPRAIVTARMACMTTAARCLFVRLNSVADPTVIRQYDMNMPGVLPGGAVGQGQDVVNVSRNVSLRSSGGARANYLQRCPADGDVVGGVFTFSENGAAPYDNWLTYITTKPLMLRKSVFANTTAINNVQDGVVAFTAARPVAFAVGAIVNIRTRIAGNGPRVYAQAKIKAVDVNNATLDRWAHGNCGEGTARTVTYSYSNIVSAISPDREARTRKTGGPFTRFRGRR